MKQKVIFTSRVEAECIMKAEQLRKKGVLSHVMVQTLGSPSALGGAPSTGVQWAVVVPERSRTKARGIVKSNVKHVIPRRLRTAKRTKIVGLAASAVLLYALILVF